MKIAVFGDLKHVRSFGAQLTSACLKSDILHVSPHDSDIRFYPMPNIGENHGWIHDLANSLLTHNLKKRLRDIRAAKVDVGSIKGAHNVHYDSPFDPGTPNSLGEYLALEVGAFKEGAHLTKLRELISWADLVYINGEGNIVNHTAVDSTRYRVGARILLSVAVMCCGAGVPFRLINCTIDPRHEEFENVLRHYLPRADHVTVREPISYQFCRSELGLENIRQGVDASMGYVSESARFASSAGRGKPHVVIGDSSGLQGTGVEIEIAYRKIFDFFLKKGWSVAFFDGTSVYSHLLGKLANSMGIEWLSDHFLNYQTLQAELARASLMFSGRWHPSIQAASCGVPTVLFGADSCKTEGLSQQLDVNFIRGSVTDIAGSDAHLESIIDFGLSQSRAAILKRVSEASALRFSNF